MRKKLVFMLMLVMAITALPLHAQNAGAKLTMSFDNETLPQVFLRLEQSSTYKFLFTYDDVNKYKVTGKMQNASVLEIVDFALKNTPLEYKVNGKFINITLKSDNRQQSSTSRRTYGGYVVDENNEPVIGAQVKVVGDGITQNVITVTDLNGAFSFDYSFTGQVQVQISYVGMQTVTVPLRQGMKVVMKEDAKALGEVVVTGIFRKARESYTGSVSTIDKEQLEQFRGQNLLQTLKNVDASINFGIDNLNGSNPNNLPNINIRGTSSLPMSVEEFNAGQSSNPNTPLIIMDGFEISLTKLMDYNDEEIESINILKDAAATAIYGSRGANGVIVVVSKQPEPGKLRVNVEAGLALEVPDLTSYHLLNAADKLELERKAGLFDYPYGIDDSMSNFDFYYKDAYNKRLYDVLRGVDTDWLSKPLRTGLGQRYNLRVEGGSKEFRWAADAQWKDTEGAMKGSNRRIFNGGITLLYTFKNLTFRNYTSVGINNSKESPYGTFSDYVNMQPYYAPYDEEGNLQKFFDTYVRFRGMVENPLYNATLGSFNKSGYQELTNNFAVDWQILPELTLRGQLGISKNDSETNFFRSPEDT
ncbi:MAG: TonB-dependent receptor plug domain-containing protein, partial [Prevotella sp.]|nr:TonB-dependent receptor plug domain-containing protein [Prevotella sp.]